MSFVDKLVAFFKSEGVAFPGESEGGASPPAIVPGNDALVAKMSELAEANQKAIDSLRAELSARDKLIEDLKTAVDGVQTASFNASIEAEIAALEATKRITPAEAKKYREKAVEDPASFTAALPYLKDREPHVAFAAPVQAVVDAADIITSGSPEEELMAATKAYQAANGVGMADAMKAVLSRNGDLATRVGQFRADRVVTITSDKQEG